MFQAVRDKAGRKGKVAEAVVSDALKVLRIEGDALHERAVAYVLEGEGPELVLELAGRDTKDLDLALSRPGYVGWTWTNENLQKRVKKVTSGSGIEAVAKLRGKVYANAEVTPEQLSRLGRLLAAIADDDAGVAAAVPGWFGILAQDLALTRVCRQEKGVPAWRPEQLEAVAVAGGITGDDAAAAVVQVLLARPRERYYGSQADLGRYLQVPEAAAYLTRHWAVAGAEIRKLGAEGKKSFCAWMKLNHNPQELRVALVALCGDSAKGVRRAADDAVAALPGDEQVRLLRTLLESAPPNALDDVVTRLVGAEGGVAAIEEALAAARAASSDARTAKPNARTAVLEKAVARAQTLGEAVQSPIEVPPFEPLADAELGPEVTAAAVAHHDQLLVAAREHLVTAREEHKQSHDHPAGKCWYVNRAEQEVRSLERVGAAELGQIVDIMSGREDVPQVSKVIKRLMPAGGWLTDHLREVVPAATPLHVLRLVAATGQSDNRLWWQLRGRLDAVTDLRVLADAVVRAGISDPDDKIADLVFHRWWGTEEFPVERMWQYFAGHLDLLEKYLVPRGEYEYGHAVGRVLEILRHFPAVPAVLLPRLSGLAMGTAKTHRLAAQDVLAKHPQARALAEQGLTDGKFEVRISAAGWLANLGDKEAIPALRTVLAAERREDVRAAFLTALETLGDDIAEHLSPAKLAAEAAKGLKKKAPVSMSWFPLDALPDLRWAGGAAVPREVTRWWVVLAVKLKEPSGEGLIARYVSLLDDASRATFGSYVLRAWVAQDTRGPSAAESREHAERAAQREFDWAQQYLKQYPSVEWAQERAAVPLDEHYRRAYRSHQATYLGSATKDKGMLALSVGMPGAELATAAQHYFKAHPQRRSQAEALVRALAANGDRPAVQLLLAVSRQFKLRTVRETAETLAEQLAEARGWTADQLADRTVQTAGFEADGVLRLAFGEREFTGRITDAFTIELRNDKGKVVKTPPSTPQGADEETRAVYKEARAQLTSSKKELKAVVELQTRRLREAMTTGRSWSVEEWQEFVAGHPVMSRLAARVIWLADPGTPAQRAFRPDDGALLGVDDEDVTLTDDGRVGIAHAVTLPGGNDGADTAAAWREHLTDYEVDPLFGQLDAAMPEVADGAVQVTDRKGWLSDSFTIRGRMFAAGWKRGEAQDAGWYYEYVKEHTAAGLVAEIEFTGSFFGEENIPAAVKTLSFRKPGTWGERGLVPLADVPPVLLAEAYADYLEVAGAGAFDPDWEKKAQY
ncbi:DUF4132 domain-containing protein [Myceligenerans crystallogenes]|uniref:DUF4132 domain-containing protein n=1 Tax=Myceligenerans crystallogenes TaxID=316335 RepID=A0ABN2NJV8_9MICO